MAHPSAPTCPKCGERMGYTSSHGYVCFVCPLPKPATARVDDRRAFDEEQM